MAYPTSGYQAQGLEYSIGVNLVDYGGSPTITIKIAGSDTDYNEDVSLEDLVAELDTAVANLKTAIENLTGVTGVYFERKITGYNSTFS